MWFCIAIDLGSSIAIERCLLTFDVFGLHLSFCSNFLLFLLKSYLLLHQSKLHVYSYLKLLWTQILSLMNIVLSQYFVRVLSCVSLFSMRVKVLLFLDSFIWSNFCLFWSNRLNLSSGYFRLKSLIYIVEVFHILGANFFGCCCGLLNSSTNINLAFLRITTAFVFLNSISNPD